MFAIHTVCPNCGAFVPRENGICPRCGNGLSHETVPESSQAAIDLASRTLAAKLAA